MDGSVEGKGCSPNDLTVRKTAWLLWYLPIFLVIVGSSWNRGRVWLWVPAFLVMGVACLANAARCGRTHCYVTGPLTSRGGLRRAVGVRDREDALRSVSSYRVWCLLPCDVCRNSARQVPQQPPLIKAYLKSRSPD